MAEESKALHVMWLVLMGFYVGFIVGHLITQSGAKKRRERTRAKLKKIAKAL